MNWKAFWGFIALFLSVSLMIFYQNCGSGLTQLEKRTTKKVKLNGKLNAKQDSPQNGETNIDYDEQLSISKSESTSVSESKSEDTPSIQVKQNSPSANGKVLIDFVDSYQNGLLSQVGDCDDKNNCRGSMNPMAMSVGVTQASLVKCLDANSQINPCHNSKTEKVAHVTNIYLHSSQDKPWKEIAFGSVYVTKGHPDENSSHRNIKLLSNIDTPIEVSGVRFHTSFIYIQTSNSGIFDKQCFKNALLKICTALPNEAERLCSLNGVRQGDVLIKTEGSSTFGYIKIIDGELTSSTTRPVNYVYRVESILNRKLSNTQSNSSNNIDWLGESFLPIHPFEPISIADRESLNIYLGLKQNGLLAWQHHESNRLDNKETYCPITDGMFDLVTWPSAEGKARIIKGAHLEEKVDTESDIPSITETPTKNQNSSIIHSFNLLFKSTSWEKVKCQEFYNTTNDSLKTLKDHLKQLADANDSYKIDWIEKPCNLEPKPLGNCLVTADYAPFKSRTYYFDYSKRSQDQLIEAKEDCQKEHGDWTE